MELQEFPLQEHIPVRLGDDQNLSALKIVQGGVIVSVFNGSGMWN